MGMIAKYMFSLPLQADVTFQTKGHFEPDGHGGEGRGRMNSAATAYILPETHTPSPGFPIITPQDSSHFHALPFSGPWEFL